MDADFDRTYNEPVGSIGRAERQTREALFRSSLEQSVQSLDNPRRIFNRASCFAGDVSKMKRFSA